MYWLAVCCATLPLSASTVQVVTISQLALAISARLHCLDASNVPVPVCVSTAPVDITSTEHPMLVCFVRAIYQAAFSAPRLQFAFNVKEGTIFLLAVALHVLNLAARSVTPPPQQIA